MTPQVSIPAMSQSYLGHEDTVTHMRISNSKAKLEWLTLKFIHKKGGSEVHCITTARLASFIYKSQGSRTNIKSKKHTNTNIKILNNAVW